jgi:Tfp pilus assembly protein PilF
MHTQAEAQFFEGNRLLASEDLAAAAECFRKACALDPAFAEGWANLALVLDRCGDAAVAEHAYRQALATGCDAFELHLNFGALLAAQMRFEEAEASYSKAMRIGSGSAALWSNLGALYLGMQEYEDALACLDRALELQSDHASAKVNLAYLHLRNGDFAEGWRALEARNWYGPLAARMTCPRWHGEPLRGKSLLLADAVGHGDMIQFVRYVPLLKAMGVRHVALICHPALVELMRSVAGLDAVCSTDHVPANTEADYWSPLMSLPHYLQTRAHNIPVDIPYLKAEAARAAVWKLQLDPTAAQAGASVPLRVGLVWRGNPAFENDAQRSIADFELLTPLFATEGVSFYSLQKGAAQDAPILLNAKRTQQGLLPYPVTTLVAQLQDFADAAAAIEQLNLVITVDTAVAHLAGALGVACWVLLPDYMADWRWGRTEGTSAVASPWYPNTMRLWRQSRGGSWPEVIATVAQALRELTAKSP